MINTLTYQEAEEVAKAGNVWLSLVEVRTIGEERA